MMINDIQRFCEVQTSINICRVDVLIKDIFLLQRVMMAEIAVLLFKGYGCVRRKVRVSASASLCTVCIVFVCIMETNMSRSATARPCSEPGGLVSSSGQAFVLHCYRR